MQIHIETGGKATGRLVAEVRHAASSIKRWVERPRLAVGLVAGLALLMLAPPSSVQADEIDDTLRQLGIALPESIIRRDPVLRPLDELSREPCDQTAISNLSDGLQKVGRRREAANAQLAFSRVCNGNAAAVRSAVNILLQLNDQSAVVSAATELIRLEPFGDNGYYLRAVGHSRGGNCQQAIDDYATAIELFGNKDKISSVGYFGMMRCYEKLGQFCDATIPIETWIALNPERNDTSQTRTILADLSAKGNCASTAGSAEETVPIARPGQTVIVTASINGQSGRFVLDTGATFVSLKRSFAKRANVQVDEASSLRLNTANGVAEGKRGHAKSVALKKLTAQDVAVVVQTDDRGSYGDRIDGLLGMSFLSRFDIAIDAKAVRLKARSRR